MVVGKVVYITAPFLRTSSDVPAATGTKILGFKKSEHLKTQRNTNTFIASFLLASTTRIQNL